MRYRSPLVLLMLVLTVFAAACGGGSESSEEGSAGGTAAGQTAGGETETAAGETAASEEGTGSATAGSEAGTGGDGAVAIGVGNLPPSGVPWTGVGTPGQYVWSAVFDALTVVDEEGQAAPALAESWESVDENTWRFTLRPDLAFSNGEPLDAQAVVDTFDILLSEEGKATYAAHTRNYGFISEVTAPDPQTVEIVTSEPNPLVPNAVSIVYVVPPQAWQDAGPEGFATAPVGSGPYQVASWDEQGVALERWEGSWREAGPSAVEFVLLNDPAARSQALQSGQVNVIQGASPDQVAALEEDGYGVYVARAGRLMSLVFVTVDGGPVADERVRQALNYAVDKEAIAEQLVAGLTEPHAWPPPGVNGYDESREPYPYDPERAAQLLEEAGHSDGFTVNAEVTLGAFPADREIYEAAAGYLSEVGVDLQLTEIDFTQQWLPKFSGTDGADWEGEAFGSTWNAPPMMDAARPFDWNSCGWVNEWFCDPVAEELVNQVNATFDTDERNELLAQLLDRNMENPPSLFLVELVDLWSTGPDVSGFEVHAFNIDWEALSA